MADIADVGDLRAEVEVQQLQRVQHVFFLQTLNHFENLRGRQTELGLLATACLPLALALERQTGTQTQTRGNAKLLGLIQHHLQLGHFLEHDVNAVTQLLTDKGKTDVFFVFVTVTYDHRAGLLRHGEYRHQLRLTAGFQTQLRHGFAYLACQDFFHHGLLLVHLDGVHQQVVCLIVVFLNGLIEHLAQVIHPVVQNLWETHQYRQAHTGFHHVFGQRIQANLVRRIFGVRGDSHLTLVANPVKTLAPVGNVVPGAGVVNRPFVHLNCAYKKRDIMRSRSWQTGSPVRRILAKQSLPDAKPACSNGC